jgi:hypothetical protein
MYSLSVPVSLKQVWPCERLATAGVVTDKGFIFSVVHLVPPSDVSIRNTAGWGTGVPTLGVQLECTTAQS